MTKKKNSLCITAFMLVFTTLTMPATVSAEDLFWKALTGGKLDLYLRYRFEFVDDGRTQLKDAYANTFRTALGYSTGLFYNFGLYAQFEDVRVLGEEAFNDGGTNGVTDRAVVVDPEGTEIKQANLRYERFPRTILRLGRQEIEHRQAPLHRYIGNILWRQHWQTFDAFRAFNQSLPNTTLDYAYVWNVNRIFGERNSLPNRSDFRMDSHLLRVEYTGLPFAKLEAYGYLLDFDSRLPSDFSSVTTRVLSTQTYGVRAEGGYGLIPALKLLYTAEFANQTDYGNNPADIDVNYYLGELGASYTFGNIVDSLAIKGSIEVLEGNGLDANRHAIAFQTPLGTNHAFQGWADRFLVTPADGIEDAFATFATKIYGFQFMAMYHDLSSNRDDYDYGTELDLQLTKTFKEHYTVGLKYADYDADENNLNLQRNAVTGQAFDLTKFWAWMEVKF
jgi:hypothetical protein